MVVPQRAGRPAVQCHPAVPCGHCYDLSTGCCTTNCSCGATTQAAGIPHLTRPIMLCTPTLSAVVSHGNGLVLGYQGLGALRSLTQFSQLSNQSWPISLQNITSSSAVTACSRTRVGGMEATAASSSSVHGHSVNQRPDTVRRGCPCDHPVAGIVHMKHLHPV